MPSFDVVCRVDLQEVDNAVNQTLRDVANRFDFKGVATTLRRDEHVLHVQSADDFKVRAVGEILREKLAKRAVPAKAMTFGEIEPAAGGTAKQTVSLQQGIPVERAREMVKLIKSSKLKVQAAIQGDQLRVSGKKRDDLQAVMKLLRDADYDLAMQFVNFRD
jgi:cyclic-di-GMP-binding protein